MNTGHVNSLFKKGTGSLNNATTPFNSPDESILAWYNSTNHDANVTFSAVFNSSGTYSLRLDEYRNINFVGLVPGVFLNQKLRVGRSLKLFNVNFINVVHRVIRLPDDTTTGNIPPTMNGIIYEGYVNYDVNSRLEFIGAGSTVIDTINVVNNNCPPIPINNCDCNCNNNHKCKNKHKHNNCNCNNNCDIDNNCNTVQNNGCDCQPYCLGPCSKNSSAVLSGNYLAQNQYPFEPLSRQKLTLITAPVGLSNTNSNVDPAFIVSVTALQSQSGTFLNVFEGGTVTSSSFFIDAPNLNINTAILNNGRLNLAISFLNYSKGVVVTGSGITRLTAAPENLPLPPGTIPIIFENAGFVPTRYLTTFPTLSAITATTGSVDVYNFRVTPEIRTGSAAVSARNNERAVTLSNTYSAFLFYDARNTIPLPATTALRGISQDIDNRFLTNAGNASVTPFITIRNSFINGTLISAVGTQLYLTNDTNAILYDTDLIASKPYPTTDSEITGPILASYGSSSPVWNGSTFILSTTIYDDYTHTRLDGTIFYVDARPTVTSQNRSLGAVLNPDINSVATQTTPLGCAKDCRGNNHTRNCHRQKLTITLPSGSMSDANASNPYWHGRVIEYKRIDLNNIEVTIVLALERGCRSMSLASGEAVRLHNREGRYYVLSRVRPYTS